MAKKLSPGSALAHMRWAKPDADRDQPRRAGLLGGRPKVIRKCPKCGFSAGTAELRKHRCSVRKASKEASTPRQPPPPPRPLARSAAQPTAVTATRRHNIPDPDKQWFSLATFIGSGEYGGSSASRLSTKEIKSAALKRGIDPAAYLDGTRPGRNRLELAIQHKSEVMEALERGENVPLVALVAYPELLKQGEIEG
jgi:hypothetical protein